MTVHSEKTNQPTVLLRQVVTVTNSTPEKRDSPPEGSLDINLPYGDIHADLVYQNLVQFQSMHPGKLGPVEITREAVRHALAVHARLSCSAVDTYDTGPHRVNAGAPTRSALLMRLLAGKKPLIYPPPTSNHYPRYELVDSNRDVAVCLDDIVSMTGTGTLADACMVLDLCPFGIMAMNRPARAITRLLTGVERFDGMRFLELADEKPVWTLKHGPWPAWELSIGLGDGSTGWRNIASPLVPGRPADVLREGWRMPSDKGDPRRDEELRFGRRIWVLRKSREWDNYRVPYVDTSL